MQYNFNRIKKKKKKTMQYNFNQIKKKKNNAV